MHKKKSSVLIIGINFFPEPTGIGKYTGELAFSLASKGYNVEAITAFPYYPNGKSTAGIRTGGIKKKTLMGLVLPAVPYTFPVH